MGKNEERSYKCGCIVGQKASVLYLDYCPEHKAAPDMREALGDMLKAYELIRSAKPLLFNMLVEADYKLYHVCEDASIKSEKALAKAEGK